MTDEGRKPVIPPTPESTYCGKRRRGSVLSCRITPVHRRFAISALPERDAWRVMVSHLPGGSAEGSASICVDRVQGLSAAVDRLLERLIDLGARDCSSLHQSLGQAYVDCTIGRPGIRARSPAARVRLHTSADRYLELLAAYAQASMAMRAFAGERGQRIPERHSHSSQARTEEELRERRPLHERREALLQHLQRSSAAPI